MWQGTGKGKKKGKVWERERGEKRKGIETVRGKGQSKEHMEMKREKESVRREKCEREGLQQDTVGEGKRFIQHAECEHQVFECEHQVFGMVLQK